MIHQILPSIISELNSFLKIQSGHTDHEVILSELVKQDGSIAFSGEKKIICSVLNIEQENNITLAPSKISKGNNAPIELNVSLLFSAYFPGKYVEALECLSVVMEFFQNKPIFTLQNSPNLPLNIGKVTIEPFNLDMNLASNLWLAMGTKPLPSVSYKMRLIVSDLDIKSSPTTSEIASTR